MRPISSHLDRTNLVNKGFIIWLLGKFCLRDTVGSPGRARWLHLARSHSQSQREIWFILPALRASHIINVGYWLSVRSRWLDIGNKSSIFACLWTETESRSINLWKKNKANMQPSWHQFAMPKTLQWKHLPRIILSLGFKTFLKR